jgi:hypothetical protein
MAADGEPDLMSLLAGAVGGANPSQPAAPRPMPALPTQGWRTMLAGYERFIQQNHQQVITYEVS